LALLPEGVFVALSSILSGRVTSRTGPRVPMLVGLVVGAAGFASLIVAGGSTGYLLLVPGLVAAGIGIAFTMPAATAATIEAAPAQHAGIASGVLNAARQAGGAVGVALLGTLLAGTSFVSGLHLAMAVSTASFVIGAVVTAFAVDRACGRQPASADDCPAAAS
jgi:MFS transporter, DHA2 family, methylenomycin A resistance protein